MYTRKGKLFPLCFSYLRCKVAKGEELRIKKKNRPSLLLLNFYVHHRTSPSFQKMLFTIFYYYQIVKYIKFMEVKCNLVCLLLNLCPLSDLAEVACVSNSPLSDSTQTHTHFVHTSQYCTPPTNVPTPTHPGFPLFCCLWELMFY